MKAVNNFDAPQAHQQDKGEGRLGWRGYAAVGSMVAALAFGAWKYLDKSGEVAGYTPDHPVPAAIDNELNICSWNMEHQTAERVDQIAKVISHGKLDVMALQEVSGDDLDDLQNRFEGWYINPVVTDLAARPLEGGGYNVLMSKQEPKNVQTKSLNGTSFKDTLVGVVTGLGADVANADTSLNNATDGRQEKRAAIAMTIKVRQGKQLRDVRVVTSHISGDDRVHEDQREDLIDLVKDTNLPVIFAGDLNATPETIRNAFKDTDGNKENDPEFRVAKTGATSIDNRIIDYYIYNHPEALLRAYAKAMPNPKTDHYPIRFKWVLKPEE